MAEADATRSPTALALGRFWSRRSSRIAMGIFSALALLGIYAPLLANDLAWLWWDETGLSLPLLADLFNQWSYHDRHDLLFNILALALPPMLLVGLLVRRRWSWVRTQGWGLGAVAVIWGVCQVPMPTGDDWRPLWRKYPQSTQSWEGRKRTLELVEAKDAVNGDVLLDAEGRAVRVLYAAPDAPDSFVVVDPATGAERVCTTSSLRVPELFAAFFAPIPHSHDQNFAGAQFLRPGAVNPASGCRFWVGSDASGRDVLAVMLFGARISLTVGLLAAGMSLGIGILIGGISGYCGGWIDLLLQRVVEIVMTLPVFILVLVVTAVFSRNIFVIIVIFGLAGWTGTARLVRGEFLAHSGREYVLAAQALGLPTWRIMFLHILPNILTPILVSASFLVAGAILGESSLAFLGLVESTTPSWGLILHGGADKIQYPHLVYAPGLAIFLLVFTLNSLGNRLREAFDPKGTT